MSAGTRPWFVGVWLVACGLLAGACSGPSSTDFRRDHQELTRVFAADAHAAELADPLIGRVGSGHESADTAAAFEGPVRDATARALRLAEESKVVTAPGRKLRRQLLQAIRERRRVVELFGRAARSGEPGELLDAITAARELEENLAELDEQLAALGKRSH